MESEASGFRRTYASFREILSINDATLQLIADIDDSLLGQAPFTLEPIFQRVRKAVMEAFLMINRLNEIANGKYLKLHDALGRIQLELEAEIGERRSTVPAAWVMPIADLRWSDAAAVGSKMAGLGEIKALGVGVPDGFVITVESYRRFMSVNRLWDKVQRLESIVGTFTAELCDRACREVQQAILSAPIPPEVQSEIFRHFDELALGRGLQVATRSSAIGEDTAGSFAGQYYTELNVTRDLLEDSYRTVVASMFGMDAMLYKFERGLNTGESEMAVGCIAMIDPKCSGVMFSREFGDIGADRMVVSTRPGLNVGITSGRQGAEELVIGPGLDPEARSQFLTPAQLSALRGLARTLEQHFGSPQDIEWAIEPGGRIYILQSRPMVAVPDPAGAPTALQTGEEPVLSGGIAACPGAGAGPVYHVQTEADLTRFPDGGVVVAHHSSPAFSRVMTRCAAIVTEVGSPIGHMAILAREFAIPTIVGLAGALKRLPAGREITVDATGLHVYGGNLLGDSGNRASPFPLADAAIVKRLRRVARLVTPLSLTDPKAPNFSPAGCKSLHDLIRFVHEKLYEVMFLIGDRAQAELRHSYILDERLPFQVRLYDVGGGIAKGARTTKSVRREDIRSVPLLAFLDGLLDERIVWDQPRPISARGFMSVMGESLAGLPAAERGIGGASYAVVSDRYMNFSTKAGYHFSTMDVYCGQSQNKNYIHFKFNGGGAAMNRRLRRVGFLAEVLAGLDFRTHAQGDFLVGRLDKYEQAHIQQRLADLGRLTMCVRQLDMLMDSDAKASALAQAFLRGEFAKF
ncbi:MAG: PEP/pyruvate-binding domain-containing protein [Acidobacteriota bacterium]